MALASSLPRHRCGSRPFAVHCVRGFDYQVLSIATCADSVRNGYASSDEANGAPSDVSLRERAMMTRSG